MINFLDLSGCIYWIPILFSEYNYRGLLSFFSEPTCKSTITSCKPVPNTVSKRPFPASRLVYSLTRPPTQSMKPWFTMALRIFQTTVMPMPSVWLTYLTSKLFFSCYLIHSAIALLFFLYRPTFKYFNEGIWPCFHTKSIHWNNLSAWLRSRMI